MTEKDLKKDRHRFGAAFNTLRFQVIAIMLLCYFIPALFLGLFTQQVLLKGLQEKTAAALTSGAEHAWTLTAQNIEHAIQLGRDAIYDGELADAYSRWSGGSMTGAEYLRQGRSYLDRKYSRDPLFTFAACFPLSQPGLFMYTRSGNARAMDFLKNAQERVMELGETLDTRSRFTEYDGQLYLVRNLVNLRMERYGMLILGIDPKALFAPIDRLTADWNAESALMLDGFGEPELPWADYVPGLTDVQESDSIRYVRSSDTDEYELRLSLSLDRREQYKEVYAFRRLVAVMYLLLIPILLLIALYVRKRIVKPITLLSDASRRIEAGELGVTVPMRGGDELGDLGVSFSNMSTRLKELIDRTYKEEIDLKNAQIQALQSRINPHFINNALEDINWQARIDGSETISSMVTSLSVLLNATMARKGRRMVTLKDEMEVAEAYIYFVQQRFGSDLSIEKDLEERAYNSIVPLLTVQPVLENAVEHGIAPAGGGKIALTCRRAGECLQITIANTGKPLGTEDRARIDAALRGETTTGDHLGLANIANRLRLIYGGRASIRVYTDAARQTVVQMDIPQGEE